jgi:hypothetical protein
MYLSPGGINQGSQEGQGMWQVEVKKMCTMIGNCSKEVDTEMDFRKTECDDIK